MNDSLIKINYIYLYLFCAQEELAQRKVTDPDGATLPAVEVVPLPSPAAQHMDQKMDESKREDEE